MKPLATRQTAALLLAASLLVLVPVVAFAHGVTDGDQLFMENAKGLQVVPFIYLGAKHMVTGYDHLLFLVGVIFYLYKVRDVAIYVSLFSIGHSITLLYGVLSGTHIDPYLIDAVIGFSVTYKGIDNLGLWKSWFGVQPNTKAAVLIFGLFHGFGLATKLQDFALSQEGLVGNIVSFNVGVEVGQLLALSFVLIGMGFWRRTTWFARGANAANGFLILAGLALVVYQLTGYFTA